MKKNLLFILVALLPLVASAYDAEIDGIYYNFSGDEAEVTSGWYFETVVIPESVIYDGTTYTVTSIGKNAFYGSLSLTSVTIPNRVTSIGDYAFYDCRHLPFISIPNSVVTIGSDAFNCCYELTSITIPNSVISIGKRAFASCKELTSIIIPDGVTSIEENTFNGCRALTSVIIPENVTSIDYGAFYNCQALISVTIPDCVITIANDAFFNCRSLNSVNIPNNVTTIGNSAFYNCVGLTFLSIGKSVTNIGRNAFKNCVNLTDVYCYAEEVPKTEGTVFTFNDDAPIASATLHVPAGSLEKYKTTSPWSEFGNIVALSPDLTQIRIKDRPSEVLEYIGKIGSDFDTALDSLRILKSISSEIKIEPLEVIFDYDNRLFFGIIYGDCGMYSDVLDTKGNYYLRTWYSPAEDPVTYIKDQMATIILPTEPDASKGKYYRLDRCEDNQIIFEQELQPRARVPYIIVPAEDFSIDPNALNLEGLHSDTVSVEGVSFIGSYVREELPTLTGEDGVESSYIDFIDTTPDCGPSISAETGKESLLIGTLRAYLIVKWDDPIDHGSPSVPPFGKKEIVLHDYSTGINSLTPTLSKGEGVIYNLSGRRLSGKPERGIYIEDGKKKVK